MAENNVVADLSVRIGAMVDNTSFNKNLEVINKWLAQITKGRRIPLTIDNAQDVITTLSKIDEKYKSLGNPRGRNAKQTSALTQSLMNDFKVFNERLKEGLDNILLL